MSLPMLAVALTCVLHSGSVGRPDFTGRWTLIDRETSAWRGRSGVGAHEGDLIIDQSADSLSVRYEGEDGPWGHSYALGADRAPNAQDQTWSTSRWDGAALVVTGHRLFKAPDGGVRYDYEERLSLSADGRRLTVVTKIDMFPKDLVRRSVYERVAVSAPAPPQAS